MFPLRQCEERRDMRLIKAPLSSQKVASKRNTLESCTPFIIQKFKRKQRENEAAQPFSTGCCQWVMELIADLMLVVVLSILAALVLFETEAITHDSTVVGIGFVPWKNEMNSYIVCLGKEFNDCLQEENEKLKPVTSVIRPYSAQYWHHHIMTAWWRQWIWRSVWTCMVKRAQDFISCTAPNSLLTGTELNRRVSKGGQIIVTYFIRLHHSL